MSETKALTKRTCEECEHFKSGEEILPNRRACAPNQIEVAPWSEATFCVNLKLSNDLYPPPPGCQWLPMVAAPFSAYELRRGSELLGTVSQPMDNWVAMIGDSVLETPLACTGALADVSRAVVEAV